jgi:hypothetical protein
MLNVRGEHVLGRFVAQLVAYRFRMASENLSIAAVVLRAYSLSSSLVRMTAGTNSRTTRASHPEVQYQHEDEPRRRCRAGAGT